MSEVKKRNYKSDLDFILHIKDCQGNEIGWPDYDWTAKFYTLSQSISVEASCIGGVCTNCFNDNGQIHIVINRPQIGVGIVKCEFNAMLPSDIYPDGTTDQFQPMPIGIERQLNLQKLATDGYFS